MGIVTRPGDHPLGDPDKARGAGETSLYNPNRSNLDWNSALGRIGDTAQQAGEGIRGQIDSALDGVVEFIHELTGIDLSGEVNLLEQLLDVPLAALEGTPLGQALDMLGQFLTFLPGGNAAGFSPIAAARDFIVNRLLPTGALLGPDSPLSASKLFGAIRAELLSVVPAGALSTAAPNRVTNPNFDGPDAIAPADDFKVDMSSSRSADGTGSAVVTADGRPHSLRTGKDPTEKIPVAAGQTMTALGHISHTGAVGGSAGPAVVLQFLPFAGTNGETPLTPVVVDTYTPGTPDLDWPGHEMSGKYVVPAGVTFVQGAADLTTQALQGQYHADEFVFSQASDMSAIPGLMPALTALDQARKSLINTLASAAKGFPVLSGELGDLENAIKNFNPLNIPGSLGPAAIADDLKGIVGHLIDAIRGRPAGTTTAGSLPDLYNAMNEAINNVAGQDETTFVDTTTLVPVDPSWCEWIDVYGYGRGQDGNDPGPLPIPGLFGQGGNPGKGNGTTWHLGEHYDNTLTGVQATVNGDGSITFAIPGHQVTCLPGSGALGTQFGGGWVGKGPGSTVYNDKPYAGGGDQHTAGAAGIGPGGGGAGGGLFQQGGPGAPAGGWVRRRANDVANPSTGADTTAPSLPTQITVVLATNNSLTLKATGSVDA